MGRVAAEGPVFHVPTGEPRQRGAEGAVHGGWVLSGRLWVVCLFLSFLPPHLDRYRVVVGEWCVVVVLGLVGWRVR